MIAEVENFKVRLQSACVAKTMITDHIIALLTQSYILALSLYNHILQCFDYQFLNNLNEYFLATNISGIVICNKSGYVH